MRDVSGYLERVFHVSEHVRMGLVEFSALAFTTTGRATGLSSKPVLAQQADTNWLIEVFS